VYLESHFKFVYPINSFSQFLVERFFVMNKHDFETSWMKKAERKKKRRKDNWLAEIELPGFLDSITYAGFPNSEDRIGSRFESRRNPRCTSLASRTLARLPGWSQMAESPKSCTTRDGKPTFWISGLPNPTFVALRRAIHYSESKPPFRRARSSRMEFHSFNQLLNNIVWKS